MFMKWLDVEAEGIIDKNDELDNDTEPEVLNQQPLDKLHNLDKALPLLHDLYLLGVELEDGHIMSTVRELCFHLQKLAAPVSGPQ